MAKYTRNYPTEADIDELIANMRRCDIDELEALTNLSPACCVRTSVINSDVRYVWAYHTGGKLACILGCTRSGAPWMLATDVLDQYMALNTRRFIRDTRLVVQNMLQNWPLLSNWIDARNTKTILWLQAVGFTLQETLEIKPGYLAIRFEATR